MSNDVDALLSIDVSDVHTYRLLTGRTDRRERLPIEYLFRRASSASARRITPNLEISAEVLRAADTLFNEDASDEEVVAGLRTLANRMREEANHVANDLLRSKIDTFAGEASIIPSYIQYLLRKVAQLKVLHLRDRRKVIGREEAAQLLRLKTRRGGPEKLRYIQDTVSSLLGVQVDAFESDLLTPAPRSNETLAELDVNNFLVQVNGSGIREALRVILDYEFERPHILLVEEPEIHLHPALETSMMQYLKRISHECQVFLTTHSTNFLDTVEMRNVYLVSKRKSTQINMLDSDQAEADLPRELGIRLSSLFMFDRLVFVEGASDESIIREWASTLDVNLSEANVGFVTMGGARNFSHFAAEATLSFLRKRQVGIWFLIDRDERDDAEIAKLRTSLSERATFEVLSRREIENFLIIPRALTNFIRIKQSLASSGSQNAPTPLEVNEVIDREADKLKQFALSKRAMRMVSRPILPGRSINFENLSEEASLSAMSDSVDAAIQELTTVRDQIEGTYQQYKEAIESIWSTDKLSLIPGDLLLDAVCRVFGVRYKKERDGSRLASLMESSEIDREVVSILRRIGSISSHEESRN